MVNAFSDLAYRSDTGFSHDFSDASGFYDRSEYGEFKPGYNDGHIPHDQQFESDEDGYVKASADIRSGRTRACFPRRRGSLATPPPTPIAIELERDGPTITF